MRRIQSSSVAAFSLIEVVLAVGVISFALVGIIGLFPVAMQSALDSQRETQVAFIARSLFSEMQQVDGNRSFITEAPVKQDGSFTPLDQGERKAISLSSPDSLNFFFDGDGAMLDSGVGAVYEVEVATDPAGQPAGLTRAQVTISVPVDAPPANRKTYEFVTLLNYSSTATPAP